MHGLFRVNAEAAFVVPADDAVELVELIGRICARDQHALGRLYDLTADRVYGVALRVLGNVHDAEEIVLAADEVAPIVTRRERGHPFRIGGGDNR